MRKPAFRLKLQPIEISSEEILADLRYPAPSVPKRGESKPAPAPRRVQA